MRVTPTTMLLIWLAASVAAADEIEPLDGAFLEYLANLEADDGDWTLVAPPEPDEAEPEAANDEPAAKAKPRKPTKEAAKPAVEDR